MTLDDHIIRLRSLNVDDLTIMARLSISREKLQERWAEIMKRSKSQLLNGYVTWIQVCTEMSVRFQSMGESMKLAFAGVSPMAQEEIRALIKDDPEATVQSLMENAIVLHPFDLQKARQACQEAIQKATPSGN